MATIIDQHKQKLVELCRKYHVIGLDVFGSAATEEFDSEKSDIDFLVLFDKSVKQNRFDNFFAFQEELERLFNKPIDLVEPGGLRNPYFIESVNQTRMNIYVAS